MYYQPDDYGEVTARGHTERNRKAREMLLKTPLCSRQDTLKVRGNRRFKSLILKELIKNAL